MEYYLIQSSSPLGKCTGKNYFWNLYKTDIKHIWLVEVTYLIWFISTISIGASQMELLNSEVFSKLDVSAIWYIAYQNLQKILNLYKMSLFLKSAHNWRFEGKNGKKEYYAHKSWIFEFKIEQIMIIRSSKLQIESKKCLQKLWSSLEK